MIKTLNRELFRDKEYFKLLSAIAIPIVVQNLIVSSLNMLDTLMVGMLGDIDIAAVGIGNQIFLLFYIMALGISSGCGVFISQYWGKNDQYNIRRVMGLSLIGSAMVAVLFTAVLWFFPEWVISIFNKEAEVIEKGSGYIKIVGLSYLFNALSVAIATASRCVERTKPPMVTSIIALFCNAGLNYIFIFGKFGFEPMGVRGAALGTLIARGIEFTLLFTYVFRTNKVLWESVREVFDISLEFTKKIFAIVKDVLLNELLWGMGTVVYSVIYGRIGSGALAAAQIYNTVQNFFFILVLGMGASSVVMIGKEIGAGNYEKAKRYSYNSFILTIYLGVVLSALIALTANGIVSIFNISESVRYSAKIILYITAAIFTLRSINVVLIIGVLRGGGDAKFGLRAEAFTMWCIGVPASIIGAYVFKLPVYGVVALISLEEIAKSIISIKRLFSESWMKSVT